MRTNCDLLFHASVSKIGAIHSSAVAEAPETAQSQWRSPVPYLFGGLAAMLGLIALALLILACAYWKLFGGGGDEARDAEGGAAEEKQEIGSDAKQLSAFEEKFLVIMAGEVRPTFLATPITTSSNRASSSFSIDEKSNQNQQHENPKNQNEADVITIRENGESSQEFRSNQN